MNKEKARYKITHARDEDVTRTHVGLIHLLVIFVGACKFSIQQISSLRLVLFCKRSSFYSKNTAQFSDQFKVVNLLLVEF